MSYKAKGKIIKAFDATSGVSANGKAWHKRDFMIDTGEQYNNEIAFTCFGEDKCKQINLNSNVEVEFNINSREYNDKLFTSLNVWKITVLDSGASKKSETNGTEQAETSTQAETIEDDDLPF